MKPMWMLFALLSACAGESDPCDDLCELGDFDSVEATEAGCTCSGGGGLGAEVSLEDCADYCGAIGEDPDAAVVDADGDAYVCSCDGAESS